MSKHKPLSSRFISVYWANILKLHNPVEVQNEEFYLKDVLNYIFIIGYLCGHAHCFFCHARLKELKIKNKILLKNQCKRQYSYNIISSIRESNIDITPGLGFQFTLLVCFKLWLFWIIDTEMVAGWEGGQREGWKR